MNVTCCVFDFKYCINYTCECPGGPTISDDELTAAGFLPMCKATRKWKEAARMDKLKPCPFCGATESTGMVCDCVVPVESFMKQETIKFYSVKCACCGCEIGNHNTKEGAIEAWNRRADNG